MAWSTTSGTTKSVQMTVALLHLILVVSMTTGEQLDLTGKLGKPGYSNMTTLIDHVHSLCQKGHSVSVILASNDIRELRPDAFVRVNGQDVYGFTCVYRLDLSNNSLRSLPSGLLGRGSEMWRLEVFDASRNSISTLGKDLFHRHLENLMKVDLSHNAMEVFEPWAFLLPEYPVVDLSYNAISKFSNELGVKLGGTFVKSPSINLQHNRLRRFHLEFLLQYLASNPPSVYDLVHLRGFNISDNPWLCDCHVFSLVDYFKDSYYSYLLAYIFRCYDPPELRGKQLDYFYKFPESLVCNLTESEGNCPGGCFCQVIPARNTTRVDCRNSTLTDLPGQLPSGPLTLDLSGLGLQTLTPGRQLQNVTRLLLANNDLQSLPPDLFKAAPDLQELDVSSNRLKKLPVQITALRFADVQLSGNDLTCSCDWVWVGDWSQFREGTRVNNVTCSVGGGQWRLHLGEVSSGRLGCYTTLAITLTVTLGLALSVGVVVVLAVWKWKHKSRVLLYHVTGLHPFDKAAIDKEVEARPFHLYLAADRDNMEIVRWIKDDLLPRLERRKSPYRVYFPLRDNLGGDTIADQIVEALDSSRRAVFVVSKSALRSGWWGEEFDHAQWALEQGQGGPLLLLLYEDVDVQQVVQEPLRNMLEEGRYLSLKDKWWWKKFLYELPKPGDPRPSRSQNLVEA